MSPARPTSKTHWYDGEAGNTADLSDLQLARTERIGAPVVSRGRRIMARLLVLSILGGGAWLAIEHQETSRQVWSALSSQVMALIETAGKGRENPTATATASPGTNSGSSDMAAMEREVAALPLGGAENDKPVDVPPTSDMTTGALPGSGKPYIDPEAEAPVAPGDRDALQRRAEAVGLNPDLSRVLLARLSDADFRNARIAIETALAEVADDGSLTYPKTRVPGGAQFRVHFVAGAADNCRRYVVAIATDGWLTTALPMEKCGVKRRSAGKT